MAGGMYTTEEAIAVLHDDKLFEVEVGPIDLEGESEGEFQPAGDFVDASGSQALVPGDLLLPSSATLMALIHDNPSPAERDSVLLSDLDCFDG